MGQVVEIPLTPSTPAIFSVVLENATYNMRLVFDIARGGFWVLDIGDADSNVLVAGLPLVSGVDLLAQYRHLGFTGGLVVGTDRGAGEVPGFDDLGAVAHLYYVPDA